MSFETSYNILLSEIEEDHISGASIITYKAAELLKQFLMSQKDHNENLYIPLFDLGKKIINLRPHMACIINLVDDLLYLYKKNKSLTQCVSFLGSSQQPKNTSYEISAGLLSEKKVIMTHSYSSSVFLFIKNLKNLNPQLHVIVTESRPLNEGVRLAEDLQQERISTTFVTDAAALEILKQADLLLLGSDFITPKYFSNKVGSLGLALGAHFQKKPVYIVSDSSKYINCRYPILLKNSFPKEEVLEHQFFNIKNPYFEAIPLSYVKKILTPDGVFSLAKAKKFLFKKHLHNKTLIKNLIT